MVVQQPQPQRRRQQQRQEAHKVVHVHVDVIIPVHNAQSTIEDAVNSAMNQQIPPPPSPSPSICGGGGGGGGSGGGSFGGGGNNRYSNSRENSSENINSDDDVFECFRQFCTRRDKEDPKIQSRSESRTESEWESKSETNFHHQQQQQHLTHQEEDEDEVSNNKANLEFHHHAFVDLRDRQKQHQQQQRQHQDGNYDTSNKEPYAGNDDTNLLPRPPPPPHGGGDDVHDVHDVHEIDYNDVNDDREFDYYYDLSISVCCYDDGSTDSSLEILQRLVLEQQQQQQETKKNNSATSISSRLLVDSSSYTKKESADQGNHLHVAIARGAGYARNRAIEMNDPKHHGGRDGRGGVGGGGGGGRRRRRSTSSSSTNNNSITDKSKRRRRCDGSNKESEKQTSQDDGYKTRNETGTEFETEIFKEDDEEEDEEEDEKEDDDDEDCIRFLCWLDSDDVMHPYRVAYQTLYMLNLKLKDEQTQQQRQRQRQEQQQQKQKQNKELPNHKRNGDFPIVRPTTSSPSSPPPSVSLMDRTLLGTTFVRDPPDSTWHYTEWANNKLLLNYHKQGQQNSRLMLEQFREVTVIQPTWFMSRKRWNEIGPYVEAPVSPSPLPSQPSPLTSIPMTQPSPSSQRQEDQETSQSDRLIKTPPSSASTSTGSVVQNVIDKYYSDYGHKEGSYCLVHPTFETSIETLKLAEDLRLFYSHLKHDGTISIVTHKRQHTSAAKNTEDNDDEDTTEHRRLQSPEPLVTYRQLNPNGSQSFRTSRRLILALRCKAFQDLILRPDNTDWWSDSLRSLKTSPVEANNQPHEEDQKFVIWGAGRDGKDFFKMLDETNKKKVYCFVDVDMKKLRSGYYVDHYTSSKANSNNTNSHDNNDDSPTDKTSSKNDKKKNQKKKKKKKGHSHKIPIVHFSYLASNIETRQRIQDKLFDGGAEEDALFGRIDKSKHTKAYAGDDSDGGRQKCSDEIGPPPSKRAKIAPDEISLAPPGRNSPSKKSKTLPLALNDRKLDLELLQTLPVVVCVAMYRTNGVLERNVSTIGRVEGKTLWHFS